MLVNKSSCYHGVTLREGEELSMLDCALLLVAGYVDEIDGINEPSRGIDGVPLDIFSMSLDTWQASITDGYSIRDSDPDTESFNEIAVRAYDNGLERSTYDVNEDALDVSSFSSYWTSSGESPVVHEQGYLADLSRSAGGWSDLDPRSEEDYQQRNNLELSIKLQVEKKSVGKKTYTNLVKNEDRTPEQLKALAAGKRARDDRFTRLSIYISSLSTIIKCTECINEVRTKYRANVAQCVKTGQWDTLALTRAQLDKLVQLINARLKYLKK